MPTPSTNQSPLMTFVEGSTPSTPGSGLQSFWIASSNHHLWGVNSAGTTRDIEVHGSTAFNKLADVTVSGSSAANIDLTGITGGTHLLLEAQLVGDAALTQVVLHLLINNDTGANYDNQLLQGSSTTASSSESLAQVAANVGLISAASAPSGAASPFYLLIPNYAGTTFRKQWLTRSFAKTADSAGGMTVMANGGEWRSTAAITRLTLIPATGALAVGTRCMLFDLA